MQDGICMSDGKEPPFGQEQGYASWLLGGGIISSKQCSSQIHQHEDYRDRDGSAWVPPGMLGVPCGSGDLMGEQQHVRQLLLHQSQG